MRREPDYRGTAEVFWSGGSQAVRLPAQCRFETSEVEIIKVGNEVTLRPRGKNRGAFFDFDTRGFLLPRHQPAPDARRHTLITGESARPGGQRRQSSPGMMRRMNWSKRGTVKAVSPWPGLHIIPFEIS